MAFDESTGQMVLFGGSVPIEGALGQSLDDTWVWDGVDWTELSPASSPSARAFAGFAYDPGSRQMVLFGGDSGTSTGEYLADTWSWDGADWTPSAASGPHGRILPAMATNVSTSTVMMFGGSTIVDAHGLADDLNDTWEWSNGVWTQHAPATSPPARQGGNLGFSPVDEGMVLFAGDHMGDSPVTFNDTWLWDGVDWEELHPTTSPGQPCCTTGMAVDSSRGQLVFYGAETGDVENRKVWERGFQVPDAPTNRSAATQGPSKATLSWTAPVDDGGAEVTGYVVTPFIGYSPQRALIFMTTATTETISGLTPGTMYRFKVRAINAVGVGAASKASNPITTPNLPGTPVIGSAVAGNGQASVSWTAPANDGGSAVIGYAVIPFIGYGPQRPRIFLSTNTTQTISGLTPGTAYRFKVAAINAVGVGPQSKATNPVTPI